MTMIENRCNVLIDGETVAENVPIGIATLLARAIFDEYHAQAVAVGLTVSFTQLAQEDK